jgi:hypothetical protein
MFKNISLLLLLSFVFVPPASADFLGIGHWTEKHVTKPFKRKVIDPVVKETKHQVQVARHGKLYKGADKLIQEGRNSKAYKAADKVLVSASRAVKNDCAKSLTKAFTPLVGAVCGKVTTAALGAACTATLGTMGTPLVMPAGIASVALCVPIVGYSSQIGCAGPLVRGAGLANQSLHGPFRRINVYHRYKETINKFKREQAGRLAKLTCDML